MTIFLSQMNQIRHAEKNILWLKGILLLALLPGAVESNDDPTDVQSLPSRNEIDEKSPTHPDHNEQELDFTDESSSAT